MRKLDKIISRMREKKPITNGELLCVVKTKMVTVGDLLGLAKGLLEPGEMPENKEYARALVELCTDAAFGTMEAKLLIAKELGVPKQCL